MEKLTTGIVRRVDELGRVVIPKELRRTLRIKEGEEMEVCVMGGSEILLRKYSAVKALRDLAAEICSSLSEITGCNSLICDTDVIVASENEKAAFENAPVSYALENILSQRKSAYIATGELKIASEEKNYREVIVAPVILGGDINGGVILASNSPIGEYGKKLAELAASFFSKQF